MDAITKAFNTFIKPTKNGNVFIPRNGVTDEERTAFFTNYDKARMDRLRAIRYSQSQLKSI